MPSLKEMFGRYWRSQDHLQNTEEYQQFLHREFQEGAPNLEGVSRRTFVKLLGATAALAGLSGCVGIRKPRQKIQPYAKRPEYYVPGTPTYYASAVAVGEDVVGVLVETHAGRPTKVDGNPLHSQSLSGTKPYQQAAVMGLYDPDRLQAPQHKGRDTSLPTFQGWLSDSGFAKSTGDGYALLIEENMSPSFHRYLGVLRSDYPGLRVYRYEPVNRDLPTEGLRLATGRYLTPAYQFEDADVVVSFDSDFVGNEPGNIVYAKQFAGRRDPHHAKGLNRLYVFENQFTLTGAKADHRFRLKASDVEKALWVLAYRLVETSVSVRASLSSDLVALLHTASRRYQGIVRKEVIDALAEDILVKQRRTILIAGSQQSAEAHALVFLLNRALGNEGRTVFYRARNFQDMPYMNRSSFESIKGMARDIQKGAVHTLFVLGGDPVYTAPADVDWNSLSHSLKSIVHVTERANQTSAVSEWVIPRTHFFESWGDLQAIDGSVSLVQPVIRPLYDSVSDLEFISLLRGRQVSDYRVVRDTWRGVGGDLEARWSKWLNQGVVSGLVSPLPGIPMELSLVAKRLSQRIKDASPDGAQDIEVVLRPDSKLYDGRFVNNGWLQELPDSVTKLTWDNAAWISESLARKLGVATQDLIEIQTSSKAVVRSVVFVAPGQADYSISLFLGYGQPQGGQLGSNSGFNVYPLLNSDVPTLAINGVKVHKIAGSYPLSNTQNHGSMEGRALYLEATLSEFRKNPEFASDKAGHVHEAPLWNEHKYDTGYQWGMAIDLARCIGCNACTASCQAENNIPTVGKDQVANGRELHWIRVDRYFEGEVENPRMVSQPMTCLQCENAPCEQVCPVVATSHSSEGLNDMTYNRCIGTRYCSDNCPTKVRRFNFFDYHQRNPESVKEPLKHIFDHPKEPPKTARMQFNPDVTVRMRGVMEKCTYCVQRINAARAVSQNEDRDIRDGEIVTACQQACPTDAIVFGNILDPKSKVSKLRENVREYTILNELNIKPRTFYLASIRNPNPVIEELTERTAA